MSKHKDYTRYANQVKTEVTPAVVEEIEAIEEIEEIDDIVEEENIEDLVEVEPKCGVVDYCKMLNVREWGEANAPIISIIAAGTTVEIVEEESTEDFYGVHVDNDGIEFDGFCMKKFIRLID